MISLSAYLAEGQTVISNLLLKNYHHLGFTSQEFLLWLQLYREVQTGNLFPDMRKIAEIMGESQDTIYKSLTGLIEKKLLAIQTVRDEQGRQADQYDLLPAFEKIEALQKQEQLKTEKKQEENATKQLFQLFEQEFSRPLSAIELQRIGQWLEEDQYQPELIELALREAVLNQAYNFNYIDRVLLAWERKNIRTKPQVLEEQKRRKSALLEKDSPQKKRELPKVTMHNWLGEGKNDQ